MTRPLTEVEKADVRDRINLVRAQCDVALALIDFMVADDSLTEPQPEFILGRFLVRDLMQHPLPRT